MRLVTYQVGTATGFGVVLGDGVVPYRPATDEDPRCVRDVLDRGLDRFEESISGRSPELALDEITLLPPVEPRKILCIGVNYLDHREEARRAEADHPVVFTRFPDSHVGHGQTIVRPVVSHMLDYEGELAVVMGAGGTIAGYACYNDFTVRDWQRHTHQWTPGKNFQGVGSFGPFVVTADEINDPKQLTLETRVNGEIRQSALVRDLIFGIPELIEYVTAFTALGPGDLIVTGTPGGVGFFRDPPTFLGAGDVVEVDIPAVGLLRNSITDP